MWPVRLSVLAITKLKIILRQVALCQRGVVLPLVLLVVTLFSFLGMHVTYSAINEATMVRNYEHGVRAFYQAEDLLNRAIVEIRKNPLEPNVDELVGVTLEREYTDTKNVVHDFHVKATAASGGITKIVEMDIDIIAGNAIDLRNINTQYNNNIMNSVKRSPMPEDNMGINIRLSSANWDDVITIDINAPAKE